MRHGRRKQLAGMVLLGVVLAGWWWWTGSRRPELLPGRAAAQDLPPPQTFAFQGVGSCAAAACHNGNGPKGAVGSEYTTWITHDPHARAYEVLFNSQSAQISKNLKGPAAHENRLCLSCHVDPAWEAAGANPRFALADGVGCESCHGAAQNWLADHSRPSWQTLNTQDKANRGMRDTKSLAGRAQSCVGCHVGLPGADVNHDLIAAGHPRLNFEFGAYHANLPRHRPDAKDKDPGRSPRGRRDFEAAAWAVGQLVTAGAALELLQHRAKSAIWPEFAEYDCFACHHDLQGKNWRQRRTAESEIPGSLAWNSWNYGLLPEALALTGTGDSKAIQSSVNELGKALKQSGSMREAIQNQAHLLREQLFPLAGRVEKQALPSPPDLFRRLGDWGKQHPERAAGSWDAAAQFYLALAAVLNAWNDQKVVPGPSATTQEKLQKLGGALRYSPGFNSPKASTAEQVRQAIQDGF